MQVNEGVKKEILEQPRVVISDFDFIHLLIPGAPPSKKNHREVRKRKIVDKDTGEKKLVRFMGASKTYRQWEEEARWRAKEQIARKGLRGLPTDKPLQLEVRVYYRGNRPDLDAVHTAVMDALEGICWVNDKQIERFSEGSCVVHTHQEPCTIIEFREIEL